MSFVEQDDVLKVLKDYGLAVAKAMVPHKTLMFGDDVPMISYRDSMDKYGIDRPDLRIPGMEIVDLSAELKDSEFGVFS
jgi:aspartyl-tRNA synthetase